MHYVTKDGAIFTRWYHPILYVLAFIIFWPLYFFPPDKDSHNGLAALSTLIFGWFALILSLAGILSIIMGTLYLSGQIR